MGKYYDVPFTDAVMHERRLQRQHWGNDHDDRHLASDWGLLLLRYAGKIGDSLEMVNTAGQFDKAATQLLYEIRDQTITLATLGKALADRIDREIEDRKLKEMHNK